MNNTFPPSRLVTGPDVRRRDLALLLLCGLLLLALLPRPAYAQSCWVNGTANVDFGTVTSAGGDTSASVSFQCQAPSSEARTFRLCVFVGEGTPTAMAPRQMTDSNGAYMNYDLYSDSARSLLLGPPGGNYPLYTWLIDVPAGSSHSGTFNLFGRVPAGQSLPATQQYQGHPSGSILRYTSKANGNIPASSSCRNNYDDDVTFSFAGVYANFANTCRVITATDLDFGSTAALAGNRDQTSTIQLQCPLGTTWRVGLNNGINATGTTRRMLGPGGNYLSYELYRDNGRTQRWGNTLGTDTSGGTGTNASQSLTVYGRVPAQSTPVPGSFSDTVTVTLTY